MVEKKEQFFLDGVAKIERPTNVNEVARLLGLSQLTVTKYVGIAEAKGLLKTKWLGRQRLIL
jgi:predicted transcriptional regulator